MNGCFYNQPRTMNRLCFCQQFDSLHYLALALLVCQELAKVRGQVDFVGRLLWQFISIIIVYERLPADFTTNLLLIINAVYIGIVSTNAYNYASGHRQCCCPRQGDIPKSYLFLYPIAHQLAPHSPENPIHGVPSHTKPHTTLRPAVSSQYLLYLAVPPLGLRLGGPLVDPRTSVASAFL